MRDTTLAKVGLAHSELLEVALGGPLPPDGLENSLDLVAELASRYGDGPTPQRAFKRVLEGYRASRPANRFIAAVVGLRTAERAPNGEFYRPWQTRDLQDYSRQYIAEWVSQRPEVLLEAIALTASGAWDPEHWPWIADAVAHRAVAARTAQAFQLTKEGKLPPRDDAFEQVLDMITEAAPALNPIFQRGYWNASVAMELGYVTREELLRNIESGYKRSLADYAKRGTDGPEPFVSKRQPGLAPPWQSKLAPPVSAGLMLLGG